MTPAGLLKEAKSAKLDPKKYLRHELVEALLEKENADALYAKGVLEMVQDYGFLRKDNYHPKARSSGLIFAPGTPFTAWFARPRRVRNTQGCCGSRA
jgi:hypothetical protein